MSLGGRVNMRIKCDEQTEKYLREIVAIHARRMILENVDYWWLDRPLMVVFAGLIKAQKIKLPMEICDQAQSIAQFCHETCVLENIDPRLFRLYPENTRVSEYSLILEKLEMSLLIT